MPRKPEQNAEVRENRKKQILHAALNTYIRYGYHGTDMDGVAEEARLAKGLVYYYYKSKKELFAALYTWMFNDAYAYSSALLEQSEGMNPIEQLMYYTHGMFEANRENPRMMQFAMRVPFDAYAVFGPDTWRDGARKSDTHRQTLAALIEKGVAQGFIPPVNASSAANSFWSVFVANVFEYAKLMTGTQEPHKHDPTVFKDVVRFCFQGLGIEQSVWNECLMKVVGGNEGI